MAEAFARCAREQLDRAVHDLSDEIERDPVEAVHDARKALKRERALLRLARGAMPAKLRARENRALRDAARRLSATRDAEVIVQTVDKLADHYAGQLPENAWNGARAALAGPAEIDRLSVDTALHDLRTVQARLDSWTLDRDGWGAIAPGLVRTYRRGRSAYRRAHDDRSFENLHEWRKRAKDLWYELRLLAPVCGEAVKGQAKEAHELADLLGDDHDLGVLRDALIEHAHEIAADLDTLLDLIDHRREQLEREAFVIGARLYAEKPNALRRRMRGRWKASRAGVLVDAAV